MRTNNLARTLLPLSLTWVLLTGVSATVAAADIKERTIKFPIVNNIDHPQGIGAKKFAELVEQKSGGKMKVKVHPGGVLGGEVQVASAMQGGTVEASMMAPAQLVGMIKEFVILDFPFSFANEKEADYVLDGPVGKKLIDMLPAKNLIGLAYMDQGFRSITNSKRPINKLEDIQGLKIRTIQNPLYVDMLNTLGANAVPMAFPGALFGARNENRRWSGESLRDGRGLEVLRGAEVLQQHAPHLQPAADPGEQEVLGQAFLLTRRRFFRTRRTRHATISARLHAK